ncbi:hypothetical protein Gotur_030790, partial [Gossypium turneri]
DSSLAIYFGVCYFRGDFGVTNIQISFPFIGVSRGSSSRGFVGSRSIIGVFGYKLTKDPGFRISLAALGVLITHPLFCRSPVIPRQDVVLRRSCLPKISTAKELHFNKDGSAIKKLQTGVNKLADLVGVTLGAKGRNVILESKYAQNR